MRIGSGGGFKMRSFLVCTVLPKKKKKKKVRVIKSKRLRWTGHVARMEKSRDPFKILMGKPTGKRHRVRPRRR